MKADFRRFSESDGMCWNYPIIPLCEFGTPHGSLRYIQLSEFYMRVQCHRVLVASSAWLN
jgi:hypothetical protein